MKLLKLVLSDHSYQAASEFARIKELEVGQFASGLLEDALAEMSKQSQLEPISTGINPIKESHVPDTVTQIQEISRCVWLDHKDFNEAVRIAAYKFKVRESTVRDKCTRRINVQSTSSFLDLLRTPSHLIDHLCRKFPRHETEIKTLFTSILPEGGAADAPSPVPRTQQPQTDAPEMELVGAIVTVLKRHGGKLDKPGVEREVFEQYKSLFLHPWYQEAVGEGIPRWQKNLQFARNTACHKLGLIKPPDEAGRGIWELTEKGLHGDIPQT